MAIRYTKDENAFLRREVASFRKKIRRLQKKGVSQGLLPTNIKVSDLKRTYDNWEDLEARLEQMRNFSSVGKLRTNQKGLVGTDTLFRFKQQEIDEGVNLAKQRRETLRQTKERSAVKTQSLRNLTRKIEKMSKNIEELDFKMLQKINQNSLTLEEYSERSESFYESFFKMLFQSGNFSDYNDELKNEIQEDLKKFTPAELSELLDKEDTFKELMDKYEIAKSNNWYSDAIVNSNNKSTNKFINDTKADFRVALNNLRRQMPRMLKEYGHE